MQLSPILFIIFLYGCSGQLLLQNKKFVVSDGQYFQRDCMLFKEDETLKAKFPGRYCHFLDDGSFLSAEPTGLTYFDKYNKKKWIISGHFHHQIKTDLSKKRILALSSDIVLVDGENIRFDSFLLLDFQGNILHKTNSHRLMEEKKIAIEKKSSSWVPEYLVGNIFFEASHFNSFYEIPKHQNKEAYPFFPPGAFIVSSGGNGTFILSEDLQKIIHHFDYPRTNNRLHDVQMTPEGHLLMFVNQVSNQNQEIFSEIHEVDPLNFEIKWKFSATPKQMFYSPYCGGVQKLDSQFILFSDVTKGVYVFDILKKDIVFYSYEIASDNSRMRMAQEIKLVDLKKFFESRKDWD